MLRALCALGDAQTLARPVWLVRQMQRSATAFECRLADRLQQLAGRGLRVIVAGLDLDFRGEPFGPMPVLMAQAERVDKLQAICMVCGEPACRTQRLVNGRPAHFHDPVVIVGAAELYEARCRQHHQVPRD